MFGIRKTLKQNQDCKSFKDRVVPLLAKKKKDWERDLETVMGVENPDDRL